MNRKEMSDSSQESNPRPFGSEASMLIIRPNGHPIS